MQINAIQSSLAPNLSTTGAAGTTKGYDTNMFMQVILAQLQNQNPLEPLKDAELMSQFTQLNSLAELQSMSASIAETAASFQAGYASSLIGKQVRAGRPNGTTLEGEVTSVIVERQKVYLLIGDEKVSLDSVTEITEKPVSNPQVDSKQPADTQSAPAI